MAVIEAKSEVTTELGILVCVPRGLSKADERADFKELVANELEGMT